MSVKIYAVIFGIVFLVIGILGFVPIFTPSGYLLGVFTLHPMQNSLHILTGVVGLIVASSAYWSRMYFKIIGIIYLFLAVLAFLIANDFVFMRLNTADNLFHLIAAAIALYLGFGKPKTTEPRT